MHASGKKFCSTLGSLATTSPFSDPSLHPVTDRRRRARSRHRAGSDARGRTASHHRAAARAANASDRSRLSATRIQPRWTSAFERSIVDRHGAIHRVRRCDDDSVVEASTPWSGVLQTIATDARGRGAVVVGPADVDVNNRIVVLQAGADALGFAPGAPIAFDVAVETTARFSGARVDGVPDGGVRSGRLAMPLAFAADGLPVIVDTPSVTLRPGERAPIVAHVADRAALGDARILLLYPDDAPGDGDAQVVTFRNAEPATPPLGATTTATPAITATATTGPTVATSESTGTATPSPTPSPSPTPPPTEEPTRAPRLPTVVLPVEPTATPASTAPPAPSRAAKIFLPFAYRRIPRPRP